MMYLANSRIVLQGSDASVLKFRRYRGNALWVNLGTDIHLKVC